MFIKIPNIKKVFLLFLLIFQLNTFAQKKSHEIGFFAGAAYYTGELNNGVPFYSPSLAYGFLYRYDINKRYALKLSGTFSRLTGNDASSKNPYEQWRGRSFSTFVSDFAAMFEFSFLPFQAASLREYYSFYLTAGLGAFYMRSPAQIPVHPTIPFGIGFKYGVSKRMVITGEWTYRKTFTDYIDQLPPDEYTSGSLPLKQSSYDKSKDWYSFAGITITYKFALGRHSCPAYGYLSK